MRWSVWVAALFLAAAASALRTNQDQVGSRQGRRLSISEARGRNYASTIEAIDIERPSPRSRGFNRHEEISPREASRTRTRSRPEATTAVEKENLNPQTERNEQFTSRRTYSRTRNRTSEPTTNRYESSTPNRNYRSRQTFRTAPTAPTPPAPTPRLDERHRQTFRRAPTPAPKTTPDPLEVTSPKIDEAKIEVINSNLEDIPKMVFNDGAVQFRRRSSSSIEPPREKIPKGRGRNNRVDVENKPEADLVSSGTTNNIAISEKEQTTARNAGDIRSSRKLRYRTRLVETDTNLTGQGIAASSFKSSQINDSITSQPELQTSRPIVVESASAESNNLSTTSISTKATRRPIGRSKVTFRPPTKVKLDDEISEDDNYPESFKALLQVKNASTQAISQSENLLVKASQKVYKTFSPTSPSINNDTEQSLSSSKFRKNQGISSIQSTAEINKQEEPDSKPIEKNLYKRPEYKPRAAYTPRNKKPGTTTTTDAPENSSTQKPLYKFNRKFKVTTTTSSPDKVRRLQSSELLKKSFYPRFKSIRNATSAEKKTSVDSLPDDKETVTPAAIVQSRELLPRTSYYSRLRSAKKEPEKFPEVEPPPEKNYEKTFEKPLIYTQVTSSGNDNTVESDAAEVNKEPEEIFVIAVTSKESHEKITENGLNMDQSTEDIDMSQFVPTTAKYHASYKKIKETIPEDNKDVIVNPPLRNIHPRQYSRRQKLEESNITTEKNQEIIKFSDLNAKTASTSSNGITPEPEKTKGRFSSKYRASYLDKPFYKATVPSVTPTTAWLKFFVTDRELTKSVQEPIWFEGEPLFDVITESVPRTTLVETLPIIHQPSIELVEGEENDLGSGMKSITIIQTRRTLSSEDLRLSESVVKPSHVMNVEASQHSPSVTVSIFDALADILTSTPRPRLSTTTEVTPKTDINIDVKQTLNGVSNKINVTSVRGLASEDILMSTSSNIVTANTKPVQTTDQTTPVSVINRMSVGERVTLALDAESSDTPVNTPPITPVPDPTTPISARRPFAIKVLYSEPATDMTTPSPNNKLSTDNPATVYNTQSDLLLPGNNIVSSELTSMLTNNINDLLKNVDENTRSKLTVDMEKLLKSLIPRAVDGLTSASDGVDTELNTTPYSLEDIRDTEITMNSIKNNTSTTDVPFSADSSGLQTVMDNINVNTEETTFGTLSINVPSSGQTVKISDFLLDVTNTPVSDSNSQAKVASKTQTSSATTTNTENANVIIVTPKMDSTILSDSVDNDTVDNNSSSSDTNAANQDALPIPFFTNSKISDFTLGEVGNLNDFITELPSTSAISTTASENTRSLTPNPSVKDTDVATSDPNTISPLQLWVLNKKAQVLKMIEELIKQHNDEIGIPPPLTDNRPNAISERLNEIINNMNMTTASDVSNISDLISTLMTTTPVTPDTRNPLSTVPSSSESTTSDDVITSRKIPEVTVMLAKKSVTLAETTLETTTLSEMEMAASTTPVTDELGTTETSPTSLPETTTILSSTTIPLNDETSTLPNEDSTTQISIETTTLFDTESTITINTESIQTSSTETSSTVSNNTPWVPPKKDYVIFGILPNDTVVRKDPNQDVLESLTEASPYIVYGVLPNNTIIRKFPNGTRIPRVMQKIDILPISPWSLRNPYSPIHNNPAIVRPISNPIRVSTNVTSTDTTNNGMDRLTSDTVNNQQPMISSPILNLKDRSAMGTTTNRPPTEKSTASHVLSLRTTTMNPSIDVILLNSISSAAKEEKVILSMTSSTSEPRILTLDIDPETKQIRTEKPANENMNAVFKFIPIDQIMTSPQDSNVLKLASRTSTNTDNMETISTVTEMSSQTSQPQIQTSISTEVTEDPKNTVQVSIGIPLSVFTEPTPATPMVTTEITTNNPTTTEMTPTSTTTTITISTTEADTTTTTEAISSTTTEVPSTQVVTTSFPPSTPTIPQTTIYEQNMKKLQEDALILQNLLGRSAKNINNQGNNNRIPSQNQTPTKTNQDAEQLLQALLLATGQNPTSLNAPTLNPNRQQKITTTTPSTTTRSIEEDIRQYEEDTKLLKALLQATGQNPANFNIPSLNNKPKPLSATSTTTTKKPVTSSPSIEDDIKKFQEDAKLLQALLQATGQNPSSLNIPALTGVTTNLRTPATSSNPTTALPRPVYVPEPTTSIKPELLTTVTSTLLPVTTTFQPRETTTANVKISTTNPPFTGIRRRVPTTTDATTTRKSNRNINLSPRFAVTTESPSTSTFSPQEDLAFLKNLKNVLNTNNIEDPETALANRIIALAVEKSLNEIQATSKPDRDGKAIANGNKNFIPTTTERRTTTTTTTSTTTTPRPTTTLSTPSIEEDIKQFEQDAKLLQALLKATGQNPANFNIPTLTTGVSNVRSSTLKPNPALDKDLTLLSNLLSSPSPLNEPFDPLTVKPLMRQPLRTTTIRPRTFGAKIAVKDDLTSVQDDKKLLQTLIKLQGAQESTTARNKITITGQSPDEALTKLLQKTKPAGSMMSDATQAPMSLSTEYGKSQDALLAALLKEQGFGPTTASSLDEQIRLAALLNQVVVTPKARTTTTPPPPPQAPRRPVLDGLAWLWQQWRETAPGPNAARPSRRPSQASSSSSSTSTSNRVNWFGSGPFVGNAEEKPTANRIPLEPPSVVTQQAPGRGQLVSAAINVTRAFSQFLGAAIQGAAQTVQSVIRAGQRAASDVYTNGSG